MTKRAQHIATERLSAQSAVPDKLKKPGKGTPEKSGTPSQDTLEEVQTPSRNFIWDEELEKLQIKEDDLQKIREPKPPEGERKVSAAPLSSLTVRKTKPVSEWNQPKPKVITVSKKAPADAPVKPPDSAGYAGPRYYNDGSVIPHSILGFYEDFRKEAVKRGDLLDLPEPGDEEIRTETPTVKYEKKKSRSSLGRRTADESKALNNWQLKMMERKKQQGYISNLLKKNPEDLAMNQADSYRQTQEERHIIDRTIPLIDYGKGYRVGSEFWKQQERFGDEFTGLHMTLTQTEKGYPQPVEHIRVPQAIRNEKGWHWAPTHTRPGVNYPWHKAPYLEKRKKQLQKYTDELDPHQPECEDLAIVGTSNPYQPPAETVTERQLPELYSDRVIQEDQDEDFEPQNEVSNSQPTPVFGPSLLFSGQPARWTGDSFSFQDQVGIEARVTFEAVAGDRITSYLTVINDGTTAVYYDWKRLPKENPFDLVHSHVQRFYFNNSSGVVLPGETMKFPFVFKSPNAGVFHEQWKFETRPVVCGGASLLVTLRGIAIQEDKYKQEREQLEADLKQKQAEQIVRQLLGDIINGIRTPERPRSPVDAYITDEEIFNRNNPRLNYHFDAVKELKQLYVELAPPEEREGRFWDLCVEDLKDELMQMDEDDERKEPFLHQLNTCVSKMSFKPQKPLQKELYKAGYQLLLEAVDSIVSQSCLLRQMMGLPEKEDDIPDDYKYNTKPESRVSRKGSKTPSTGKEKLSPSPQKSFLSTEGSDLSDGKRKGKKEKSSASTTKEPPKTSGKLSKEPTKTDLKGKTTPGPPAKKPPSRGGAMTAVSQGERERTGSPSTLLQIPFASEDPVVDRKYKEKLFAQAYLIMGDTVNNMETVFDTIMQNDQFRPPLEP